MFILIIYKQKYLYTMDYFEENTNYSEEDINKILLLRNDVKNKILKNTQSVKENEEMGTFDILLSLKTMSNDDLSKLIKIK